MSLFTDLVNQGEDFYQGIVDWPEDDNEKELVLNEIATAGLHFSIARIYRATSQGRVPARIRFRIDVQIEEAPDPEPELEVVESKLILP